MNEIRDSENYYKQTGFPKEKSFYSKKRFIKLELLLLGNKLKEKIPDPRNAKNTINHL